MSTKEIDVQRWTGIVAPHGKGGFVAVGDYMTAMDEIAALRKDAERYRWLKRNPTWLGWEHDFRPDEVEREIDAAMFPGVDIDAAHREKT